MSESGGEPRSMASHAWDRFVDLLLAIRGSFLLFVGATGVLMFVFGATYARGLMAGMFAIWGASAVIYALLGFALLRLIGYR